MELSGLPARYPTPESDALSATVTWTCQSTLESVNSSWLPSSGMRSANTPDFERYDERFNGATGEGGVELWLGVQPA